MFPTKTASLFIIVLALASSCFAQTPAPSANPNDPIATNQALLIMRQQRDAMTQLYQDQLVQAYIAQQKQSSLQAQIDDLKKQVSDLTAKLPKSPPPKKP